ncbi:MAG: hypothetical protein OEY33_07150 [Bdellovibrionales bacterium]|nr:hypothetical protein [Bdellovibrionales bacterium]
MQKLILFILLLSTVSCSSTVSNKNPLGKVFPSIQGTSLVSKKVNIPEDFKGKMTLLLLGYKMDAQFDIDRWLLGLTQLKVSIPIYELPTIKGMIPRLISSKIDQGMRDGIPKEDWVSVITIYKDSEKVINFTGNEKPLNGRVALIDENGKVVYFHDRGYSAKHLLELVKLIKQ